MTGPPQSPLWHPFTQHALEPAMTNIVRAEGAWLQSSGGARIFDAISSWWVVTHGHCHPEIIAAIKAQTAELDHVIFAGFTHQPAEALARGLIEITPAGLVSTLAGQQHVSGSANGQGTAATFSRLNGIAVDTSGNVYVTDGNMVRKMTAGGLVSTLAGSGTSSSVDGTGTAA